MRGFLFIAAFLCATVAWAAPRESAEAPAPDDTRGITAVRRLAAGEWIRGDWALKLVMQTGKGKERVQVPVDMVGGWTAQDGRWQRIRLPSGRQWIIKGRAVPTLWELKMDGQAHPMGPEERAGWVHERLPMSWEIFSMGFLTWPELRYLGVQKARARWCDVVELTGAQGAFARAKVWVDVEFGSPVEAELYDSDGRLVKTVRAVSVQKIDAREWILKRWEAVDEVSHAKVSVDVVAVATGGQWDGDLKDERSTPALWPQIPQEAWRTFE